MTITREQLAATLREAHPDADGDPGIEGQRRMFADLMSSMQIPAGLVTTPTELGGRPTLEVRTAESPRAGGTILYFHGGANVVGSPETALSVTGGLVVRTGYRALSVDYRLAPEHPFPANIDDCLAAYRALLEQGVDPQSVAFAGDSAGGGLTVTTTLAARDAGLPLPAAIAAFSPSLDQTRSGESMRTKADLDPFLSPDLLDETGRLYRNGADPTQPLLSPAIHADLTGFPPLWLAAGTNEVLLDDAVRLAARAREQEVDVILEIGAGLPHVFQTYTGQLDEAGQSLDRAALFLGQQLG